MRISTQSTVDTSISINATQVPVEKVAMQGSLDTVKVKNEQNQVVNFEISDEKIHQVVNSLNEILKINQNSSKFIYHEGLDRYYVQVVNKDTDEVVKEIPSKKLLDAFYEMQKLVGMIVDEKI